MANEVKVFDNLKVKEKNGQVMFDAESSAIGLGLTEEKNGVTYVRWRTIKRYLSQEVAKGQFITEPQFYKLAIKANNETAEKFQEWVTSEVLPSIRKHGAYMTDAKAEALITNRDNTLSDLLIQAGEQLKAKDLQISEMKPKALFADAVDTSTNSVLIGQLAKMIKQNGVEIGQNRLFSWLREHGYLVNRGEQRNLPTQKSLALEIMETKTRTINNPDGSVRTTSTPKVTGKGQIYFVNKFLEAKQMA